jgi:YggT family protein
VTSLICQLLNVYVYVLIGRVILSWFPMAPGSALAPIYRFLYTVTEPVLGPVRRMMPSLGGFDLSPLVVILLINLLARQVCAA